MNFKKQQELQENLEFLRTQFQQLNEPIKLPPALDGKMLLDQAEDCSQDNQAFSRRQPVWLRPAMGVAACLVIAVGSATVAQRVQKSAPQQEMMPMATEAADQAAPIAFFSAEDSLAGAYGGMEDSARSARGIAVEPTADDAWVNSNYGKFLADANQPKQFSFPTEQAREQSIAQKIPGVDISWVNGMPADHLKAEEIQTDIGTVQMVNLLRVCEQTQMEPLLSDQLLYHLVIYPQPSAIEEYAVTVPVVQGDSPELVTDADGNSYYTLLQTTEPSALYATPQVMRNIFGWDVQITPDGYVVIFMDQTYRVTKENSIVKP